MKPTATTFQMILRWVRENDKQRLIAWGYYLAIQGELEPYECATFLNIFYARNRGISA